MSRKTTPAYLVIILMLPLLFTGRASGQGDSTATNVCQGRLAGLRAMASSPLTTDGSSQNWTELSCTPDGQRIYSCFSNNSVMNDVARQLLVLRLDRLAMIRLEWIEKRGQPICTLFNLSGSDYLEE